LVVRLVEPAMLSRLQVLLDKGQQSSAESYAVLTIFDIYTPGHRVNEEYSTSNGSALKKLATV